MPAAPADRAQIDAAYDAYRKSRRTVFGHLVFFLICVVVTLVLRRWFRFPPQLSWVLFAVFFLVFARDFLMHVSRRRKLKRLLPTGESSS